MSSLRSVSPNSCHQAGRSSMQGALADIMLMLALSGRWTPQTAQQLQESVLAYRQSDDLLRPLLDAASGGTAVDGSMPMSVQVAFNLITVTQDAGLSPRDRVLRDLYWLHQAANSTGRRTLEPVIVKALAEGWRHVLEHQRFALSMPMRSAPGIAAAIEAIEQNGVRGSLQVIEATADAARVDVSAQWRSFLASLSGRPREAA